MMPGDEPPQSDLERRLDRVLREQPLRRAPATLSARVLGELTRRAGLPWWQRSFGYWPPAARITLTSLCIVLVVVAFFVRAWAGAPFESLFEHGKMSLHWVHPPLVIVGAMADLAIAITRAVPAQWIYGSLLVSATLYAALFALCAVAYRTLFQGSKFPGHTV